MSADEPSRPSVPGDLLDDRYRIVAPLAEGGEGEVLRARRISDGATVAIKRLHMQRAADAEARARFLREARALNGLQHPHIIKIVDFGFDGAGPYLVTELMPGYTLEEAIERGPMDPEFALDRCIEVAAGLAYAHAHGVIHRDVKPGNVFVTQARGQVFTAKLFDFGLARFFDSDRWADAESLTRDGAIMGTPIYMPPEQAFGQVVSTESDVYSLGVLIFETITGYPPFDYNTRVELIRAHAGEVVPRLSERRPELGDTSALDAIIARAMGKQKEDRYADAGILLTALQNLPRPLFAPARRG